MRYDLQFYTDQNGRAVLLRDGHALVLPVMRHYLLRALLRVGERGISLNDLAEAVGKSPNLTKAHLHFLRADLRWIGLSVKPKPYRLVVLTAVEPKYEDQDRAKVARPVL